MEKAVHYVTVPEILEARDKIALWQEKLRQEYFGCCVVIFTMNIPGPEKTGQFIHIAFMEGYKAIGDILKQKDISVAFSLIQEECTGYVAFFALKEKAGIIKKYMADLEISHDLGRLFDIDILDKEGRTVSRQDFGYGIRKCILCGNDAKICGRSRAHEVAELKKRVNTIIINYLKNERVSVRSDLNAANRTTIYWI